MFSDSCFCTHFLVQRGECACTPVRFFVIVSMQRSGSGWFETLLNSHPNVSSNGEIFSVRDRRENISTILGTLDKLYSMDWLTSAAKNECTAAFGLKWMLNQVNYHCIPHFTVVCVKVYSVSCFWSTHCSVSPEMAQEYRIGPIMHLWIFDYMFLDSKPET